MSKKLFFLCVLGLFISGVIRAKETLPFPIVFVRDAQIWTMDIYGTEKQLTFDGQNNTLPQVSPDGEQIAYVCPSIEGYLNACLMNVDGTEKQVVTVWEEAGSVNNISWSPSGTQLLVQKLQTATDLYRLYLVDLKQNTTVAIKPQGEMLQQGMGTWSEDGTKIAYPCAPVSKIVNADPNIGSVLVTLEKADICVWSQTGEYKIGSPLEDELPFWRSGVLHWIVVAQKAEIWNEDKKGKFVSVLFGYSVSPYLFDTVAEIKNGILAFEVSSNDSQYTQILVLANRAARVVSIGDRNTIRPSLSQNGRWLTFASWGTTDFKKGEVSTEQIYYVDLVSLKHPVQVTKSINTDLGKDGNATPRWIVTPSIEGITPV